MQDRAFRPALHAIHVVAGLEPEHGGPSYSVPRLCAAMAASEVVAEIYAVARSGAATAVSNAQGFRETRFAWDCSGVPLARELRLSSGLAGALREAAGGADVIHSHGLWLMPNVQAGWAASRRGTPFVVSPRGMLSQAALTFSRRRKQLFWALVQGRVVRRAACIHATSDAELQELRELGVANPVTVIPNGIDLPELVPRSPNDAEERVVLSLGRIHPKKGLDALLNGWARIEDSQPGWRLRIVGPSEGGHDDVLRALVQSLGLSRVSIEGPIYGDAKLAALRNAELFVLPTLNENFGMTVAEALAAEVPVISTRGAPWSALEREGCGWWVDHGADSLARALSSAMAKTQGELSAMGENGRRWMDREFSWNRVGQDMADVYRWLASGSEPPPTVQFHRGGGRRSTEAAGWRP